MIGSLLWLIRSAAIQAVIDRTIRADASNGLPGAIERKHHVSRRTVAKALASAEPPASTARKKSESNRSLAR